MQETQTTLNANAGLTTLETIEGVGTSSVKIREGRQTISTAKGYATISGSQSMHASSSSREATGDITSREITTGGKEQYYKQQGGGIRIPVGGTYKLTITIRGGSSSADCAHKIKINGVTKYSGTTNTSLQSNGIVFEENVNFGKYSLITHTCDGYYSGSSSGASWTAYAVIELQQL